MSEEAELPFGISHDMIIVLIALAIFIFLIVISQAGQMEKVMSFLFGKLK